MKVIITALIFSLFSSCYAQTPKTTTPATAAKPSNEIICGAAQLDKYLPYFKNKNIALLVNQTAMMGKKHLVDTLLKRGVKIKLIFAPEHGFRGGADAGEHVKDTLDKKTGIRIVSLYGDKVKPSAKDLAGIDIVVFDIQDVGARFFTFISSLHYLMEACAENGKELFVLDRPNPNGWYVGGPVLQPAFKSFVGVDPIPVMHGLTVGEYAMMVNGEKWLPDGAQCKLKVIPCLNYDHTMHYSLPVKPSPNLPTDLAIQLYPSICFFEGTNISVGRGTSKPFQQIGAPSIPEEGMDTFTPRSMPGAKNPPLLNQFCYGIDFTIPARLAMSQQGKEPFSFGYIITMYQIYPDKANFFLKTGFFDKLCGTDIVRKMITEGKDDKQIQATYQKELDEYKGKRKRYLLYPDFKD